jgi:hypothetical protein
MKQHSAPLIVKSENVGTLERISLGSKVYDENWIQTKCFESPKLLPFEEIEPTFGGMIPICMELSTDSGPADSIYINENGFISIVECKLWRNPEARRKVVGQILDYAKELAKWNYDQFQNACLKARVGKENSLFEIIQFLNPDAEESMFIDRVQRNLNKGRFLLLIVGDGIRENMEELADYIHRNGNLNFTLGLVELPVFKNPFGEELIVTPRILAKTKEIERTIYRVVEGKEPLTKEVSQIKPVSKTISEKVFYERLRNAIGNDDANRCQAFVDELSNDLDIHPKLGRGKLLSLNLKSSGDTYNFGSIQESGEVWFYGIVNKAEEVGNKQVGVNYLKSLATLVGGQLDDSLKEWHWGVKRNGQYLHLKEYFVVSKEWKELIADTLEKLGRLEDDL